ncbi:hypothetical protein MMC30_004197 [Trapelia coarctata]|nr:hypothetical protein [Trapelia coarctata]
MTFALSHCTETDFPRLFTILSTAFGDEPYLTPIFPLHYTPSGRLAGTQRLLQSFHSEPGAQFMKVTDTSTGEIIGLAKWLIFKEGEVPTIEGELDGAVLTGDWWESEAEKEYAGYLFGKYLIPRRRAMREKGREGRGLISLDLLCVAPEHQNRGAGSMLVGWGRELADQMGSEMIVEAAVLARVFYERCGYRFVEDITIPVPEKWENRRRVRYLFMHRPAVTKNS